MFYPHSNFLLPSDKADNVDLSSCMFRMHKAVGGSWTEYQKSDTMLCHLVTTQLPLLGLPNPRTCPFCKTNHGTPRHYVMECPETELYANEICDAVEGVLASLECSALLIDAANKYFATTNPAFVYDPSAVCSARWPILSAWRWLVRIPAREEVLRTAPAGQSDPVQETAFDLAYRCVLPAAIGYAIHTVQIPLVCQEAAEDYATIFDSLLICKEQEALASLWKKQKPTILVVTTLALGLRKLRAEVRRRVGAWKILASASDSNEPLASQPTIT